MGIKEQIAEIEGLLEEASEVNSGVRGKIRELGERGVVGQQALKVGAQLGLYIGLFGVAVLPLFAHPLL